MTDTVRVVNTRTEMNELTYQPMLVVSAVITIPIEPMHDLASSMPPSAMGAFHEAIGQELFEAIAAHLPEKK
jgi:hypothetical protein